MGLLAAAAVSTGDAGVRWGLGVTWLPEMHPSTSEAYGTAPLYCSPSPLIDHGSDDRPTIEVAAAFLVWAFDECGMFDERDRQGRARRLLEATQSKSIAAEFWNGTQAQAAPDLDGFDPATATWLAKAGSTALGAATDDTIVAKLDEYIAVQLANGTGMIHMTVENLSRLAGKQKVRREGRLWLSPFDNIVVADAGYTDDTKAIATTSVEVFLGDIRPTDFPSIQSIDLSDNDVIVWAQRDVIVLHEPHLVHGVATFS